MLGYNLRDVVSIEVNHKERYLILHLKFLSYQLFVDDKQKLRELIIKLQEFDKEEEVASKKIDMPDFYSERTSNQP